MDWKTTSTVLTIANPLHWKQDSCSLHTLLHSKHVACREGAGSEKQEVHSLATINPKVVSP